MPHPYVDSATVANDQITLRVEVTEYGAVGGLVEISGEATQVGGALAIIFAKAQVPATPNGDPDNEDDKDRYFVNVTAGAIPPHAFRKSDDITVFVRVARVWVTVLGEQPSSSGTLVDQPNSDDATWGVVRADARITDESWPQRASSS